MRRRNNSKCMKSVGVGYFLFRSQIDTEERIDAFPRRVTPLIVYTTLYSEKHSLRFPQNYYVHSARHQSHTRVSRMPSCPPQAYKYSSCPHHLSPVTGPGRSDGLNPALSSKIYASLNIRTILDIRVTGTRISTQLLAYLLIPPPPFAQLSPGGYKGLP